MGPADGAGQSQAVLASHGKGDSQDKVLSVFSSRSLGRVTEKVLDSSWKREGSRKERAPGSHWLFLPTAFYGAHRQDAAATQSELRQVTKAKLWPRESGCLETTGAVQSPDFHMEKQRP